MCPDQDGIGFHADRVGRTQPSYHAASDRGDCAEKRGRSFESERLENLQKELSELREKFSGQKAQWDNEKHAVEKVSQLREELESLRNEIKIAQQNYDLEKAAELQYGKLPQLEKQLEQEEELIKNKDMSLVHESVTEEEIARIISRWTGIPVAKLNESERNKTLHLAEELHKRVIGQDEGVTKVSEAIIPFQSGYQRPGQTDRILPFLRTYRCR